MIILTEIWILILIETSQKRLSHLYDHGVSHMYKFHHAEVGVELQKVSIKLYAPMHFMLALDFSRAYHLRNIV